MNYIDYRKQLGISWNNDDNITAFRTVTINSLESVSRQTGSYFISENEYLSFCNNANVTYYQYGDGDFLVRIIRSLKDRNLLFEELLVRYVALINCFDTSNRRNEFKKWLVDALNTSYIPVEVFDDTDGCFIFPHGAKELDDPLVSELLVWVQQYPKTHKKYCESLRRYSRKEFENISDVADDFRKVLETFFQEFFNQNKSLENMKKDYGGFLKTKGVPSEMSNDFVTILNCYTNFMNDYAKHHDATSEKVLEYIMYQTGNIIRLLISLNNSG